MIRHTPVAIFEALKAATFTIDQVAAALMIRPMVVWNYHIKNGLDLCSEAPGRGSPRLFCLMDVYMLALLREIVPLTNNGTLGARDVNRLVFSCDPEDEPPLPPSKRAGRKRLMREDIEQAHELFTYRCPIGLGSGHFSNDWFLLTRDVVRDGFRPARYNAHDAQYRAGEFTDLLHHGAIVRPSGAFVNATMALTLVDRRMIQIISKMEPIDA